MPKIKPTSLKSLREMKRLSQQALADKTGVNKATISRIERGHEDARARTIEQLSKFFGVEPEVLSGNAALPEPEVHEELDSRSQLNVRIRNANRNALQLVASRYSISPALVVELAPFLFVWAAEESLKRRREGVECLEQSLEETDAIRRTGCAHLSPIVSNSYRTEEIIELEKWSIEKKDIWGASLEADDDAEALPHDYDDSEENPFVRFLKSLAPRMGGGAEFEHWISSPTYRVCEEEARQIAGGDEGIAEYIIAGDIPLHEMPKDLRVTSAAIERIKWLNEQHLKAKREIDEVFPELVNLLKPAEKKTS